MTSLVQLGIILGFSYGGYVLATLLSVPLPASVISLLLLLLAIQFRIISAEMIDGVSRFLGVNMAFFFLPSAVGILENYQLVKVVLLELVVICLVSTMLTFLATYATVHYVQKLLRKGNG